MRSQITSVSDASLFRTLCALQARSGLLGLFLAMALSAGAAHAQIVARPSPEAAPQAVPGFWDPRRRPDRPDLSRLSVIRFLTETDYPPFNFTGPDGNPAGFNVDLARQLCEEIKVTCTVQMRRFDTLLDALASNRGDAIIASVAASPQLRARVDFIFGDAISLAFWVNGTDSAECCAFSGGPFVESRYFGEGIGIAVRKGNDLLRQALNWALFRVWEKGRYTDLWLRYFSVSPF